VADLKLVLDIDLEEAAPENFPIIARQLNEWSGALGAENRIASDFQKCCQTRKKQYRCSIDIGAAEPLPVLLALRDRLYDLGVSFYFTLLQE